MIVNEPLAVTCTCAQSIELKHTKTTVETQFIALDYDSKHGLPVGPKAQFVEEHLLSSRPRRKPDEVIVSLQPARRAALLSSRR